MKYIIKHEIKGRIRVHICQKDMTCKEADILLFYMEKIPTVTFVKVYERTADAVVCYEGSREDILKALCSFRYETAQLSEIECRYAGRELNTQYKEKLIGKILCYIGRKFLPLPVRAAYILWKSAAYISKGIKILSKGRLEVEVLDATAIGVSLLHSDFDTAGSVMFLLGIGELLEEWTHKKSVDDLARSMSLRVNKVWLKNGEQEVLVPASEIQAQDEVVVHMGNVIPFDGIVISGEALVNQASLTGESRPVRKEKEGYVYAGTVLEEGELVIQVKHTSGSTRYEKIVTMIEESEKLKSGMESRAETLADGLVPYTLAGTVLTWLVTRNITKALAVLMVDFSCALKLAMPISVLSAIREANFYNITVKGGKFMEAVAEADTIVFDKTGTLTKAKPMVKEIVSFTEQKETELLRIAACLEEHFPHSMARAVVDAAKKQGLDHEEMHSKVNYIVAHGISSYIEDKKVVIGSYHFVFEDENCTIKDGFQGKFHQLSDEYSHLYLAIDNELAAVICIEDPLRKEAKEVIQELKAAGLKKVVMMTGDSEKTASAIAKKVEVDEYYSEVLPEEKAGYVEKEKRLGRKVIMIGDGINDSPALSAADAGIAISDGAEIAREIADITIAGEDLHEVVTLRHLSSSLMRRINRNYRAIIGINSALIGLGVAGVIQPTTSALLHNTSTIAISLESMRNLQKRK